MVPCYFLFDFSLTLSSGRNVEDIDREDLAQHCTCPLFAALMMTVSIVSTIYFRGDRGTSLVNLTRIIPVLQQNITIFLQSYNVTGKNQDNFTVLYVRRPELAMAGAPACNGCEICCPDGPGLHKRWRGNGLARGVQWLLLLGLPLGR